MPDYDLSGLSTRSFEKLIQALAAQVLGAGTITFGDGPDGGREATFEGKMDYPSQTDPWDGYCVIQAKFLQRPRDAKKDGNWALKQLEGELKDFADPKKKRQSPDYYIFATNAVLTPVQKRGSKDRAAALFRKYQKKVPIRDWGIWDRDEIGKHLDIQGEIRRVYAGWITPGDVLFKVMEMLEQLAPGKSDFLDVMTGFLAKELRSDQSANLEQAGHSAEERIPLARVFVDLPTTPQRTAEPPSEDEGSVVSELVADLVERARDSLDPASTQRHRYSPEGGRPQRQEPQPGRFVLVGGPGQGKTTVGQFACQLFRAALLRDRPSHLLAPEVADALEAILEQCQEGKPELPRARRFPVRITLSAFAAALNADDDLTLLAYIAGLIERRSGRPVAPEDLRRWLATYPWVLVLDGLDEVPPSTNRDVVLRRVEDFWIDAAQVNADVLVLATTRPQGYNDDFSPAHYRHLWLAPLSSERALVYAERLVRVRYAGEDRRRKILQRLGDAARQEATARLMRSPLQITIMATLVDQIGTPPQDRWRLFHEYYSVIYNRERERPIPAAELLRDHKENVDAIHHQVGFLLQVESERAGGTEAKLPAERFAAVVEARLEGEGFSGERLGNLRDRIIDAAANRLVFLVGLEAGQVGFEIRSLQEYMAAEALMSGSQESVQERLRCFAASAAWRNVFLFAAGRCFARDQHLRDTIYTICIELNDHLVGPVGRATLAGSVLALELLEDGVARQKPRYEQLFGRCAVRLLELPPADIHGRLADACEGEAGGVLREELESLVASRDPRARNAWAALLCLVGQRSEWARKLADRLWPEEAHEQLIIFSVTTSGRADDWMKNRVMGIIEKNSPKDTMPRFYDVRNRFPAALRRSHPCVAFYDSLDREPRFYSPDTGVLLSFLFIEEAQQWAKSIKLPEGPLHPDWVPLIEGIKFARNPTKDSLAASLSGIINSGYSSSNDTIWLGRAGSWLFSACLESAPTEADLQTLSKRVQRGEVGDLPEWLEVEQYWKGKELSRDELLFDPQSWLATVTTQKLYKLETKYFMKFPRNGWAIDRNNLDLCIPLIGSTQYHDHGIINLEGIVGLLSCLAGNIERQKFLMRYFYGFLGSVPIEAPPPNLQPELLAQLIGLEVDCHLQASLAVARWALSDIRWLECLDLMGRKSHLYTFFDEGSNPEDVLALFSTYPDRIGLLSPIVGSVIASGDRQRLAELTSIRYEDYGEPRVRWAGLLIELIQGVADTSRAAKLAAATVRFRSDGHWNRMSDTLCSALEHFELFDGPTESYLLELRQRLPADAWHDHANVLSVLNSSLRQRGSGVANSGIWRSLELPEKLLGLTGAADSQPED